MTYKQLADKLFAAQANNIGESGTKNGTTGTFGFMPVPEAQQIIYETGGQNSHRAVMDKNTAEMLLAHLESGNPMPINPAVYFA